MFNKCPGSLGNTPTLKVKKCPECGGEVEVFSNDIQVRCDRCGFTVYNELESCIQWCKYAKECVGEELYKKFKKQRVAFVGLENAGRSILAEALAKELNGHPNLVFLSAGTDPAPAVDPGALAVLQEENISWKGRPKSIAKLGPVDVLVAVGPEVVLPGLPEAKIVKWDLSDPKGKEMAAYRKTAEQIKEKIRELVKEVIDDDEGKKKGY